MSAITTFDNSIVDVTDPSDNFWTICPTSNSAFAGTDIKCLPMTDCLWANDQSSALCCPRGHHCRKIAPISCDLTLQDVSAHSEAKIKTALLTTPLVECGVDKCCPHGYTCEVLAPRRMGMPFHGVKYCARNEGSLGIPGVRYPSVREVVGASPRDIEPRHVIGDPGFFVGMENQQRVLNVKHGSAERPHEGFPVMSVLLTVGLVVALFAFKVWLHLGVDSQLRATGIPKCKPDCAQCCWAHHRWQVFTRRGGGWEDPELQGSNDVELQEKEAREQDLQQKVQAAWEVSEKGMPCTDGRN